MTDLSIPHKPEDITSEWLTAALRSSGIVTTSSVTSIDAGDTEAGHGFTGQIARLTVTYDSHEEGAPDSIIAKFPSRDPVIRKAVTESAMSYERELRCYEDLLGHVHLTTPQRYHSAYAAESGDCILLLQDLAPARFGDNVGNPSREDVDSAIRAIGKFHAEFWESPRLVDLDWLPGFAHDAEVHQLAYREARGPFLSKWSKFLPGLCTKLRREQGKLTGPTHYERSSHAHPARCHYTLAQAIQGDVSGQDMVEGPGGS